MKKIIQISLVVILMFVAFQAVIAGSLDSSGTVGSRMANRVSPTVITSADTEIAACLVRVKGVICVNPHVGWNS